MFSLEKKVALITGAGSGIGAAIAATFAKAGARVYLADRDLAAAQREAAVISEATGREATPLLLDVTSEVDAANVATRLREEHGAADLLVNNAGIGCVGTLLSTSGEELDRLYEVNVRGVFNVSKALLPDMIARRSGNIINLASVGGLVGIRDRLAYCTTKFAVVGLTKSMALDHAAERIRVNCICPGRVETPFVSARLAEYPDPEAARVEMSSTQLFERMIFPEEIAAAALYLASDESVMITGTAFSIDSGWTAGK